jgi:spectinomycin phosphotransferase
MNTPPRDLGDAQLVSALASGWNLTPSTLLYLSVGFGSHHWVAAGHDGDRWFVTVDDLGASHLAQTSDESFRLLQTAFRSATGLRDAAGLAFVVAPVLDVEGQVLRRLGDRYAIAVFPHLDVRKSEFGQFVTRADRDDAMRLVGQVHNATGLIDVRPLRRQTLAIRDRQRLVAALRATDAPWTGGPYAEPARALLVERARSLGVALQRFDALAASVMREPSGWVVTHGEPHAANVIRTCAGDMVMVDWDTIAIGPRERDLWMLLDERMSDLDAYREVVGAVSISEEALRAYETHWDLSEIASYTGWLWGEHDGTEDTRIAWAELQQYMNKICERGWS